MVIIITLLHAQPLGFSYHDGLILLRGFGYYPHRFRTVQASPSTLIINEAKLTNHKNQHHQPEHHPADICPSYTVARTADHDMVGPTENHAL